MAPRAKGIVRAYRFAVIAAFAACNTIAGIEEPIVKTSDTSCVLNSDCPNQGDVCIFRICSRPCQADRDCNTDSRCLQSTVGTACVAGSIAHCSVSLPCPDGSVCANGECRNDCAGGCLADQTCVAGVCRGNSASHDPSSAGSAGSAQGGQISGGNTNGGNSSGGSSADAGVGGATGGASDETGGTASQAGAGGAGAEAGAGPERECPVDGAYMCSGHASAGRMRCDHGAWALVACSDGELCDTSSTPAGACKKVEASCVGRQPGEVFCDGVNRSVCGPDLVSVQQTACLSAQHCSLSTTSACAVCLPNDHLCQSGTLQRCRQDLTGFETQQVCTTDPCNADAGACTTLACLKAGDLRCNGDALERCKTDRSGYDLVQNCGKGLCDPVSLQCDVCPAGTKRCKDGATQASCSSDGQVETPNACLSTTPHCTGAGLCVECTQSNECTPPSDCYSASCNGGSGACEFAFRGVGAACNGGHCRADGQCVECTDATQCTASNECNAATCTNYKCGQTPKSATQQCAGGYCNGGGACVQCNTANQCGGSTECDSATCTNNACGVSHKATTQTCTGGHCNGSGACVECNVATDCGSVPECSLASCVGNKCGVSYKGTTATCTGGFCNGSGSCVACNISSNCGANLVCRNSTCQTALHAVGGNSATSTTSSVAASTLYLMRLPALQHPAQLLSFGIIGTGSGASAVIALYPDNGSGTGPTGSPVAITSAQVGLFTDARETNANPPNAALAANTTYWLGFMVNVATSIKANADAAQVGQRAPGQSYPTFPASPVTTGNNGVLYAVYMNLKDTD